jgi:hypothetical protein
MNFPAFSLVRFCSIRFYSFKRKGVYKTHVFNDHGISLSDEEASSHKTSGCTEVESPTSDIVSPVAMQPLYSSYNQPSVHSSQYLSSAYAIPTSSAVHDDNWMYGAYANSMPAYPAPAPTLTVQPSYGQWYDNAQLSQQGNMLYALEPTYSTSHSHRQSPRSSHHTPSSSQGSISTPHNRSPAPSYHSPTGSPQQVQVGMPANEFTTYANLNYRNTTFAHNSAYYQ